MKELRSSENQNIRSSSLFSEMFCSFGSSMSNEFISGYEIDVYKTLLILHVLLLLRLETAFLYTALQST